MNYDFSNMKGKAGTLYRNMWGETDFDPDDLITNKNWTGEETNSSFYLNTSKTAKLFKDIIPVLAEEVAEKFGIGLKDHKQMDRFKEKFKQACSGSGQEVLKIATMHSSSLCSLLFFYNIFEGNKLGLRLGNKGDKKTYIFEKSFFEFQNVVIEGRQPSNMDIVLVGYEETDGKVDSSKPVVLFLESKFSEYYSTPKNTLNIAESYLSNKFGGVIYEKLKQAGYDIVCKKDDDTVPKSKFRLIAPNKTYIEGIKQMISHYIGVRNLLDENRVEKRACEAHQEVVDAIDRYAKVFLGTIIFDDLFRPPKGKQLDEKEKYYGTYEKSYNSLAEVLNKIPNTTQNENGVEKTVNLTVLEELLTYTELVEEMKKQNFQLDEKVKDYYFGKKETPNSGTPA